LFYYGNPNDNKVLTILPHVSQRSKVPTQITMPQPVIPVSTLKIIIKRRRRRFMQMFY
jgi:hypothetical protein